MPVGALISVRAGETIPADGEVMSGESKLNRAILTGESADVHVDVGDTVYAGTLNRTAELRVSVKASGDDSRLALIAMKLTLSTIVKNAMEAPHGCRFY